MNASEAVELLNMLGCHNIRSRGVTWMVSSCPLALWKHAGGTDTHPSFGISLVPGGTSKYKCFTCGASGTLLQLIWMLKRYTKRTYDKEVLLIQRTNAPALESLAARVANTSYGYNTPPLVTAGSAAPVVQEEAILSESTLDVFVHPKKVASVWQYLTNKRKLLPKTIDRWEILWHAKSRRIALPVRDVQGRLVAITGRAFDAGVKPKFLHSKGFRRDWHLFGECFLDPSDKKGHLVEGHFDVIFLSQAGLKNVFGVMGSALSKKQLDNLREWCDSVTIFPDGDLPGREAAVNWESAMSARKILTSCYPTPDGLDPDELSEFFP